MRRTSSTISVAVLVAVLSAGLIAAPASAMQREGPRRDDPIVRIVKQLLKKFGIIPNEEPAVPHP